MCEMYAKITGKPKGTTKEISGEEYYAKGYEDSVRVPTPKERHAMRPLDAQIKISIWISPGHASRGLTVALRYAVTERPHGATAPRAHGQHLSACRPPPAPDGASRSAPAPSPGDFPACT